MSRDVCGHEVATIHKLTTPTLLILGSHESKNLEISGQERHGSVRVTGIMNVMGVSGGVRFE